MRQQLKFTKIFQLLLPTFFKKRFCVCFCWRLSLLEIRILKLRSDAFLTHSFGVKLPICVPITDTPLLLDILADIFQGKARFFPDWLLRVSPTNESLLHLPANGVQQLRPISHIQKLKKVARLIGNYDCF